jgi:predicted dehydrogenase
VEVFTGGRIGILDDFRTLEMVTESSNTLLKSRFSQDKGHLASWKNFVKCIEEGKNPPIPYDQLIAVTQASIAAIASAKTNDSVDLE